MSEKTELRELETLEVSLVDKGANKRVFAIKKSEKREMDVIEAILAAPFEKSEAILERLRKAELSEQAVEGIKSAVQILSAFQEEVPENLIKELMSLGGLSKQEEEEEETEPTEESPEGVEEPPAKEEEEEEDALEKKLDGLPKDMKAMVEQLFKSNKDAVKKAEELEIQIKKAADEKRLFECVEIAKSDFSSLPANAEQLAVFIKSLDGSDNSEFVLGLLRSSNEMISKGSLTSEIGKSTSSTNENSAIAKAERMAEAIQKENGITKVKALADVWKNNPNLYADYQLEKGQ